MPECDRHRQTDGGQVTRDGRSGDTAGGAAPGIEVGQGSTIGAQHPSGGVDLQPALGVEQSAGDADGAIGRLERRETCERSTKPIARVGLAGGVDCRVFFGEAALG